MPLAKPDPASKVWGPVVINTRPRNWLRFNLERLSEIIRELLAYTEKSISGKRCQVTHNWTSIIAASKKTSEAFGMQKAAEKFTGQGIQNSNTTYRNQRNVTNWNRTSRNSRNFSRERTSAFW